MALDVQICSRARIARDARFDGKFFIAVLSTGIYCRPICRSRTSKERNVRYFETAAAAAEAGFRPCLRCHPECAPGTSAWLGTCNTVSRALRLVNQNCISEDGIESLAEKLGVGSRHLRRLFLQHLGATPSSVVNTVRLHFAKKLIDETSLPMTRIAVTSGFGSVRRFNAAIRKTYDRTPSQLRGGSREKRNSREDEYTFRLDYRPPYDWDWMLSFLGPRAIPGIETVRDGKYFRLFSFHRKAGLFEVTNNRDEHALIVRLRFPEAGSLFALIRRIRSMFDLDADWTEIARSFGADPLLGRLTEARPGLRVPGCWDGFELTVRAILGQQVSVRYATALAGRLTGMFGESASTAEGDICLFPTPAVLADADLTRMGITRARAETIRALAHSVRKGGIQFESTWNEIPLLSQLQEIPGIGRWTSQYVAMRALRDPDAFPLGDAGLRRALASRNEREIEKRAEAWRPWRAYAAVYLWSASKIGARQ